MRPGEDLISQPVLNIAHPAPTAPSPTKCPSRSTATSSHLSVALFVVARGFTAPIMAAGSGAPAALDNEQRLEFTE